MPLRIVTSGKTEHPMSAIGFHITAITDLKTVGPAMNTTTKEFGILPNTFLLQRCLLSQFAYENSLFKLALQSTMHSIQVQVINKLPNIAICIVWQKSDRVPKKLPILSPCLSAADQRLQKPRNHSRVFRFLRKT